jgi:hypothetical protein
MKKTISVFLAFGLLNLSFSRCTSSKLLTIDEVYQQQHKSQYLILHDFKKTYILNNYEFTETKLKGELTAYSKKGGGNVHVYTPFNFDIQVVENTSQYFEMDKSNISKIAFIQNKTDATVLLIVGVVVGLLGIIIVAVVSDINRNGIDLSY